MTFVNFPLIFSYNMKSYIEPSVCSVSIAHWCATQLAKKKLRGRYCCFALFKNACFLQSLAEVHPKSIPHEGGNRKLCKCLTFTCSILRDTTANEGVVCCLMSEHLNYIRHTLWMCEWKFANHHSCQAKFFGDIYEIAVLLAIWKRLNKQHMHG